MQKTLKRKIKFSFLKIMSISKSKSLFGEHFTLEFDLIEYKPLDAKTRKVIWTSIVCNFLGCLRPIDPDATKGIKDISGVRASMNSPPFCKPEDSEDSEDSKASKGIVYCEDYIDMVADVVLNASESSESIARKSMSEDPILQQSWGYDGIYFNCSSSEVDFGTMENRIKSWLSVQCECLQKQTGSSHWYIDPTLAILDADWNVMFLRIPIFSEVAKMYGLDEIED